MQTHKTTSVTAPEWELIEWVGNKYETGYAFHCLCIGAVPPIDVPLEVRRELLPFLKSKSNKELASLTRETA